MNTIGWGQAVNNTIGWGQGAVNNTISWGSIYEDSYSGETELLGATYNYAVEFRARVIADGGIFEAFECLIETINF